MEQPWKDKLYKLQEEQKLLMKEYNDLKQKAVKMDSKHLCLLAIVCLSWLGIIELFALYNGINGTLLSGVVGIFGAVTGAIAKTIYNGKDKI